MTEPDLIAGKPARPRRRWWRPLRVIALTVVSVVLSAVGGCVWNSIAAENTLQAAIAETDRRDPGWRLEELEAARRPVPDEENAAPCVLAAARHLPDKWADKPLLRDLRDLPPAMQLHPEQTAGLQAELQLREPALAEARKLTKLSTGRHVVKWSADVLSTLLPHVVKARDVATLLQLEAMLAAQNGDMATAVDRCRACLNAGRSAGDEPVILSQFARMAIRNVVVQTLERVVAQGQPAAALLATVQEQLATEASESSILVVALRGDRAGQHRLWTNVESGEVTFDQIGGSKSKSGPTLWDRVSWLWVRPELKRNHAWLLTYLTDVVEVAQGPERGRDKRLWQLESKIMEAPRFAKLLCAAFTRVGTAETKSQALLRCAVAAVSVERYRVAKGQWPGGFDDVVRAGLLKAVPADPYDGEPLRLRRTKDGIVVYSVGATGTYDGTALDDGHFDPEAVRPEFRLWDVEHRRQPPRPAVNRDDPPGGEPLPPDKKQP